MNSDSVPIPEAMSYRQLQTLIESAPADSNLDVSPVENPLNSELQAWADSTQHLLESLARSGDVVAVQRTPRQVMALGSLRTHLMLGLQALKASGSR